MSNKVRKIQIETIADSKNIWRQPAGQMLAEVIRKKEAVFHAAWSHYLTAKDDPEALHDLRVDLRRLRVWVKLARDEVKTNKRARKRLKALTKASNPLRDHEVPLAWLSVAQEQIEDMPALDKLIEYGKQAYEQTTELSFSEKPGLEPGAKHKNGVDLGQWLDKAVEQRIVQIDQLMRAGMENVHPARIEIKYLRYLLEPFTSALENASELIEWCKAVQDILGDLHDIQIFRSHLPEFAGWVIDRELAEIALLPGKQAKAITKAFANARDPIIALSGWQDQELQRQWRNWLAERDDYLGKLQDQRVRLSGTFA